MCQVSCFNHKVHKHAFLKGLAALLLLMPSAKHNSTMDKATDLIFTHHFVSRCAFLPTAAATTHASWTYLYPPLCPLSFSFTAQVLICDTHTKWLKYFDTLKKGFSLYSTQGSQLVMLYNRRSIAETEAELPIRVEIIVTQGTHLLVIFNKGLIIRESSFLYFSSSLRLYSEYHKAENKAKWPLSILSINGWGTRLSWWYNLMPKS